MPIKYKIKKNWKYVPILGFNEYVKDIHKKENRIFGMNEEQTKPSYKDVGVVAYNVLTGFGLGLYMCLALGTGTLNPANFSQKIREIGAKTEAETRHREDLTDKLYVSPGYVDKNHDGLISIAEEIEFRKKLGIVPKIDTIETSNGNIIYKETYNEFNFMQPISDDQFEQAVKVYEAEATGK